MFKKLFSILFTKTKTDEKNKNSGSSNSRNDKSLRKGELGEYKINIQLDQLPKECKHLDDILIANPKSKTGYSQVDHVVITPYGLFVIETKNYSGEIKGSKSDRYWYVNKRFKMYNPIMQNYGHIKAIERITKQLKHLRFISMVSFTMRCRFSIDPELRKISSDELIIYDVELSEYIQRKLTRLAAENSIPLISPDEIIKLFNLISKENITDSSIRDIHVEKLKGNK